MHPLACVPLLSLALLLAAPAPAAPRSPGEIAARLQAGCRQVDTLDAEFVQVLRSLSFGKPQEEHGRLRLRRPARMRWDYISPERKLAVVDGERSWLYVPDENQVIVGNLDEVKRGGAAGLLLTGEIDLARDFRIEAGAAAPAAGQGSIALVPRVAGEEFSRLEVLVDLKTGLPVRIEVHTALGEVMEYRFSRVRTGMPLAEALFHFEPPPGVEILRAE
jgi:outer membrane lipoprotein carrier protein